MPDGPDNNSTPEIGPPAPPVGNVEGAPSGAPNMPPPSNVPPAPGPAPMATASPTARAAGNIPPAAIAQVRHESMLGKAVKALMGTQVDYQVDPKTGQTVTVPVKQKPGDLFRHILAGAILGGAAGASGHNFAEGVGRGGVAVQNQERANDESRYKRAQDQFKNQQAVEEKNDRQTLLKAQVAHYNALTLHENLATQGENFKFHQDVASAGTARMSPYKAAGVQFAATDVSESQMHDMIKNRPEMSTYHWEPTGTKVVMGSDGKPTYELTYSAVDPSSKVTVTNEFIKQLKEDGMEKYYPNLTDVLKAGKPLDADQYIALLQKDKEMSNDNYLKSKQKGDLAEQQARIKKDNAEAAKALRDIQDAKLAAKEAAQFKEAMVDLDKNNGDFSKIKPSSRLVIGESTPKLIAQMNAGIKEAADPTSAAYDPERAKDLMIQRDNLLHLAGQAMTNTTPASKSGPAEPSAKVQNLVKIMKEDEGLDLASKDAYAYIQKAQNLSPTEKMEALKVSGALVPWDAVEAGAKAAGVPKSAYVQTLKNQGIHVENPPESLTDEQMAPTVPTP